MSQKIMYKRSDAYSSFAEAASLIAVKVTAR